MKMTPEHFAKLRELCERALAIDETRRSAFLDEACGDDDRLRLEIESLLAHGQTSIEGSFPDSIAGYELTRELHRGGQGIVFAAVQKSTGRKVAVKILDGGEFADARHQARFDREIQILAALDHPNIVKVLDRGVTEGGAFFAVMDYVSGLPLDEYVRRMQRAESKSDPGEQLLGLFIKIADAVNAAHLRGIVHRDLKPSNIVVDTEGEPHVLDFGLARTLVGAVTDEPHPQPITITGQFLGSLPWASPEQAEGIPSKIDIRTDVYSLGVILYEMLTGKFPYEVVGTMRDILNNILTAEPTPPSQVVAIPDQPGGRRSWWRRRLKRRHPTINEQIEAIVLKALHKQREQRYQSAGDFARDVADYLAGKPVSVTGSARRGRVPAILRRPAYAAGVIVVAVGLGVFLTVAILRRTWVFQERADESAVAAEEVPVDPSPEVVAIPAELGPGERLTHKQEVTVPVAPAFDESARQRAAESMMAARGALIAGDKPEARRHFQEAIAVLEKIAADNPNDLDVQLDLADADRELLRSFATEESDYALLYAVHKSWVLALERAVVLDPDRSELQRSLGAAYHGLAWNANMLQRTAEFGHWVRKSVAVRRRLAESNPQDPVFETELLFELGHLAGSLIQVGRDREAERVYQELFLAREARAEDTFEGSKEQIELAELYTGYAAFISKKSIDQAIDYSARAIAVFSRLDDFHSHAEWAYGTHIRALRRAGDVTQAQETERRYLEYCRRIVNLRPDQTYAHHALALACLNVADGALTDGDPTRAWSLGLEAVERLERLVSDYPSNSAFRGQLANAYGRVAQYARAGEDPDRADEYARKSRETQAQANQQRYTPGWTGDESASASQGGVTERTITTPPSVSDARQQAAGYLSEARAALIGGDKADARQRYQEAIPILDQIAIDHVNELDVQLDLADACQDLADTFAIEERDYALLYKLHKRQATALERAVALEPDSVELERALASAYHDVGWNCNLLGSRGSEYLSWMNKCVAIRRRLAESSPDDTTLAEELDFGRGLLASALLQNNRPRDAAKISKELLSKAEARAEGAPDGSQEQMDLAAECTTYAHYVSYRSLDEAIDYAGRAVAIFSRLDHYNDQAYWAHGIYARCLRQVDRVEEARQAERSYLEYCLRVVDKEPNRAWAQYNLSAAQIFLGDAALSEGAPDKAISLVLKAIAIREQLVSSYPVNVRFTRSLAEAYGRMAQYARAAHDLQRADEYAQKARQTQAQADRQSNTLGSTGDQ